MNKSKMVTAVICVGSPIRQDILREYVDIVFANEEEAEAFAGSSDPQRARILS